MRGKKNYLKRLVILMSIVCLLSICQVPGEVNAGEGDVPHQVHLTLPRGPHLATEGDSCDECHTGFPRTQFNVEYDRCIPCHSPDGAYDGMNDPDIGARYTYGDGAFSDIYDSEGNLKEGKEKWCVGCHDDGSCTIQGIPAPSVAGQAISGLGWESPLSIVSGVSGAENLLDGSLETGCNAGEIIFDLGDPTAISHIRLYIANASIFWNVYGGNDLMNWTKILFGQGLLFALPRWETSDSLGGQWNEIRIDRYIPFRYLRLVYISAWPLDPCVVREFEYKKDLQYGYYATGHKIACTTCHNIQKTHIDGNQRTYTHASDPYNDLDLNNYQNGYRLKMVEIEGISYPPLEVPRTGCNWGEYPRLDNDFALCFACHDKSQVLGDAETLGELYPIVDNTDAFTTGTWGAGSGTAGYYGIDYLYSQGVTGEPTATCTWTPNLPSPGLYRVYARWTSWTNRATDAQYIIHHSGNDTPAPPQDQTQNGGMWVFLDIYEFDGNGNEYITLNNVANNYVIADAVKFEEFVPIVDNTDAETTGTWGTGSGTSGYYGTDYLYIEGVTGTVTATCTWTPDLPSPGEYNVYARWTSWDNRATNAQYTIHHNGIDTPAPPQDQTQNGGTWVLLGCYEFDGGGDEYVTLTNLADNYVIADAVRFGEFTTIPLETNFRNDQHMDEMDQVSNEHLRHLRGRYYCGNGLDWDSDWDGAPDSPQSCTGCHNIHGTSSPAMIRHGELTSTPGTADRSPMLNLQYINEDDNPDPDLWNVIESIGAQTQFYGPGPGTPGKNHTCNMCHNDKITYYRIPIDSPISDCRGCHIEMESGQSHTTHIVTTPKGPILVCTDCHANTTLGGPHLGLFADGKSLAETAVCDDCHSPGGAYDGIDDPNIGAKVNWPEGVYQTGDILKTGKEKWCAGCHDGDSSVCNGVSAPNIERFFVSGHGRPSANIKCLDCHDASSTHIDGEARTYAFDSSYYASTLSGVEYASGYRLRYVGGQVPLMIPANYNITFGYNAAAIRDNAFRMCFNAGCHDSSKVFDDTPGDGFDTRFKASPPHPPLNYSYGVGNGNEHVTHILNYVGPFCDSDWDTSTIGPGGNNGRDSLTSCSACHNVHGAEGSHGSTNEPMVRDGSLAGRTGYGFSYVVEDTAAGGYPMVTSTGATQSTSVGAIFRYNTADMCYRCHGDPTPPPSSYNATGPYLEYYRPYTSIY